MIYGINFGGDPIPDGIKRKFAAHKKFSLPKGVWASLQGVAQSEAERNAMVITATNGHRQIFVVERNTAGGLWFGIYCT